MDESEEQNDSSENAARKAAAWTPEEDDLLRHLVTKCGKKWAAIALALPARQGKQCRERWHNHLDPAVKKGPWTQAELAIMAEAHGRLGNSWAAIAKLLPGRADNHVKNFWNTTRVRNLQPKKLKPAKRKRCDGYGPGEFPPLAPTVAEYEADISAWVQHLMLHCVAEPDVPSTVFGDLPPGCPSDGEEELTASLVF